MTSTITYFQNGIKVTKITKNGQTTTYYGDTVPQTSNKLNLFETQEEKETENAIRRVFFKSVIENDSEKLNKIYNFAIKNPKKGLKIFAPQENDYFIDLSLFYKINSKGDVVSIYENSFKIMWLMHLNFWRLYPTESITYIYVDKEQRELLSNLGYNTLLEFIDEYHIQDRLPKDYIKAYGSYIEAGIKNHEQGEYTVILKKYGESIDSIYDITKLKKITSNDNTYGSTFELFSDNTSNDENPESDTKTIFERHQMELQEKYGSTIDTELAKIA